MTYAQIIKAKPALDTLKKLRLPYGKAKEVYRAAKTADEEFDFFVEEEKKLILATASKDKDGEPVFTETGAVRFDTIGERDEYVKAHKDLEGLECAGLQEIMLTAEEIGNQTISPETIEALEGIVTFE